MRVRHRKTLLSHGNIPGREIALSILERTMQAIDASHLVRELLQLEGDRLTVGELTVDLGTVDNVYVLGAGKGILQIAEALDEVLGPRISKGLVIEKRLSGMRRGARRIERLRHIEVVEGGHPVPEEINVEAARRIVELAREAGSRDLVLCCVQGGCTCLTTLPADGLRLDDIRAMTSLLLRSGLEIQTINSLRSAVTLLSDGRLAMVAHPARIINLVVTDAVWGYPQSWTASSYSRGWGPCVPAPVHKLEKLTRELVDIRGSDLWKRIPPAIREHLSRVDPAQCLLTDDDYERVGIKCHTYVLANTEYAAQTAQRVAAELGLNAMVLTTAMEGEAKDVGVFLASVAKEIVKNNRPIAMPAVVVAAGELTVTLGNSGQGIGGRNQESVVSAALKLDGADRIVMLSVGTDGTDGPNPVAVAGGIVDGHTAARARDMAIDMAADLRRHDSYRVLAGLEDVLQFDEPGNNLCDLSLIVVA